MSNPSPPYGTGSRDELSLVLASAALAQLVTYFTLYPETAAHFRALQRATGISSRSLQHELARLEQFGMIQRERDGRLVRYRRVDHPRWSGLREVVRVFADPTDVLRLVITSVPGVNAAFIYGSCARGEMRADSDIDVFALGETVDEEDTEYALAEGALGAAGLLGREVNITSYTPAEFASRLARRSPFVTAVIGGPKKWLVGHESSLEGAGEGAV